MTVTNRGRLGHTFRIRGATTNVLALHDDPARASPRRATFKLGPGTYTMYCVLANHEELGHARHAGGRMKDRRARSASAT